MRVVLIIICSVCYSVCLYSQSSYNPPDVIPHSPEAANLGRYGEIQVGEYTGTPDISLPLHVITSGKIKYPLTLQYNATGIKVNQEATWVGLGWDLSASAIAYIPVGGNDKTDNLVQPWTDWERLIRHVSGMVGGPQVGKEHIPWWTDCEVNVEASGTTETPPNVILSAKGPLGAVDLYAVNTPAFSFKFYFNRATGKPTVYGDKNNFSIEKIDNTGFVITDGDGVKYSFLVKEFTDELREDTNWYLTEIRRPDGSFLIFKYQNVGVTKALPTLSESDYYGGNYDIAQELGYVNKKIYLSPSIKNLYLSEIESLTEIVKFHLGNGREDLAGNGVRKLDSISVYDKFADYRKTFIFEYGYFESPSSSDSYLDVGTSGFTASHLGKRLKLLNVTERSSESASKKYSFNYNEQKPLPYKTSYSLDHWGNYNGATNNTLVPTLYSILLFDKTGKSLFQGANLNAGAKRGANKDFITSSMLKSIVYPTGGITEFTFEPHSFKNYTIVTSSDEKDPLTLIDIYDLNYSDGSGNKYTEASFELSTDREVTFNVNFNNKNGAFTYSQLGASMNLISTNPNNVGLVKAWTPTQFVDGQNYSEAFTEKILLPAGKYYVKINVNDALGFQGYNTLAHASINYVSNQLSDSVLNNYESIGAGVRVKEIKNFDSDGSLLSSREYQYKKADGSTSGKLMTAPRYTDYRGLKYVDDPYSCQFHFTTIALINSNSAAVLSTSPIKATVGYERVVILDKDFTGSASNGKTIKTFANDAGLGYFFGSIVMSDNSIGNGEVLSIEYLDHSDALVKVDSFEYETKIIERDWINAKVQKMYSGIVPCGSTQGNNDVGNGCDAEGGYLIGVYPYINFKRVLKNKTEIINSGNEALRTKSTYEYNLSNFLVSEEKMMNSEGELIVNQHKYPLDFSSGDNIYKEMIDVNIVNPVIEDIKLKNDLLLEKSKTNYSLVDYFFIEPVSVERQVRDNPVETLLTFEKYNVRGNICQYKMQNGIYTSFIWGHDQTLPLCRVDNAKLSDIFYTGFEDTDGNSADGDSKTGLRSRTGGYTKELTGLTNQNYVLSYWLKSGANWVMQIQSIGVSAGIYKINISSSDQIDDIRFYPASAQMTSYTYIPTIGMTSSTDANNVVSYYEYDSLGRLILVRDANGKIVKQYKYHYKN